MRTLLAALLVTSACGAPIGYSPLKGETTALPVTKATAADAGAPIITARGTVENGLPFDGCSFPITVANVRFAASAATVAKVEAVAREIGDVRVEVTFRLTGEVGVVECGFGSHRSLPEIEVISIVALPETATVTIFDQLPIDGCSYPIELAGARYAPSPESVPRVRQFVQENGAGTAVIDYRLTNRQAAVQCGEGGAVLYPEIEVLALRPAR